jgi:REP element-mobilizing transposase RayT
MIREHPHRLPREAYCGPVIVAFTINTRDRQPHFVDPVIVALTQQALVKTFNDWQGHAGVYVIMPEHVHLIVSASSQDLNAIDMVTRFKQHTTYCVRHEGHRNFHWQKDFYDEIIRSPREYGSQVRYVLRNPVRRGLCEKWEDWPHRGVLGQTWEQLIVNLITL